MAINYLTQQSYSPTNPYPTAPSPTPKPVAIGPIPTPIPPKGVVYTPQHSGDQVFGVTNPPTYTSTPQGQAALNQMYTSTGGTTAPKTGGFTSDIFAQYYPGWSWNEAQADWNATGGSKANTGSVAGASNVASPTTYDIRGQQVAGTSGQAGAVAAMNTALPGSDFAQFGEQFNWDPSAFLANIDQGAAAQNAFLDKSENALKAAQEAFNQQIEADYQANISKGTASKEKAVGTLGQNQVQAEQRKQDALNSAKQLYNQLQTGYRQRFGGASSAGEAAQTILGEEQQRQSGQIGRDYQNTVAQIAGQKVDVENQFQATLLDLQAQKQRATAEALQNFQTNMRSIDSDRLTTEQAKIQAKQQILLQLRDQQNQIAMADKQYQQQLNMMREQAQLQLDTSLKTLQQQQAYATSAGAGSLGNFTNKTNTISSQVGMSGTPKSINTLQSTPQINTAVGQINPATASSQNLQSNKNNWWERTY